MCHRPSPRTMPRPAGRRSAEVSYARAPPSLDLAGDQRRRHSWGPAGAGPDMDPFDVVTGAVTAHEGPAELDRHLAVGERDALDEEGEGPGLRAQEAGLAPGQQHRLEGLADAQDRRLVALREDAVQRVVLEVARQ